VITLSSLLEKIESAYNFCSFTKEERERRNIVAGFNRSLESLAKILCKYCFLKIVFEEISLSNFKDDSFIQKVSEFDKNLQKILTNANKFKDEHEKYQEIINQLNDDIKHSAEELLINATRRLDQLNLLLRDKKNMLTNKVIASVLGIDQETINDAENLIKEFQQRTKRDIFLEDVMWANDEVSKLDKLMTSIREKASIEALSKKMKLTKEEAEIISKLVSGESVPLTEFNESLLGKIKEVFGDMAKITVAG
jgi:hypothetical protein